MGLAVVRHGHRQQAEEQYSSPLLPRPLIALDSLAFYIFKIILPTRLTFDYGRSPAAVLADPWHPLYWTWILPVTLATMIWRTHRRLLYVAGLIFVLGVLPVLGLKTFVFQYYSTVADRYVYLSMLGVAIAVAWWISQHHNRAAISAVTMILVVLGTLSFVQAGRWKDSETLYQWGLSLNQTKAVHYRIYGQYKDRLAVPYYRLAAAAAQRGDGTQANQFVQQADAFVDQAMEQYRTAIRVEPTDTESYDRLARDLVKVNQIPEAIEVVRQWIAIEPKTGTLEGMLGTLYIRNGQLSEAIAMLKQSLEIHPDPDVEKTLHFAEKLAGGTATTTTAPAGNH